MRERDKNSANFVGRIFAQVERGFFADAMAAPLSNDTVAVQKLTEELRKALVNMRDIVTRAEELKLDEPGAFRPNADLFAGLSSAFYAFCVVKRALVTHVRTQRARQDGR